MASDQQFDLGLPDALVQLTFAVDEVLAAVASEHDLSRTQLRLLGILRDREPAMLELAKVLRLEKSSVSGLIDRAQQRGLVERRPSESDGRGTHVRLTRAGQVLAETATDQVADRLAVLLSPLPVRDRATLSRLASRVVLNQ